MGRWDVCFSNSVNWRTGLWRVWEVLTRLLPALGLVCSHCLVRVTLASLHLRSLYHLYLTFPSCWNSEKSSPPFPSGQEKCKETEWAIGCFSHNLCEKMYCCKAESSNESSWSWRTRFTSLRCSLCGKAVVLLHDWKWFPKQWCPEPLTVISSSSR